MKILTSADVGNATFNLTQNKKNDTNYCVFPQIHYNSPITSGTYTPEAAYGTIGKSINGRTSTQFTVYFTKSTGDNYSGILVCLIIYNR